MKTMLAPVRDRPEFRQARASIYQLSERLNDFGWLVMIPDTDLGEDLIVHIYYQGKATGVLVHLQVKSVTNLYERNKKGYVPYSVEVKDLLHWEQFELPIVFIVWDTLRAEGRWLLLSPALEQLNREHPEWRHQKTKTIHIPWENQTNDAGLVRLRQAIGRSLYPLIAHKKQLELQINFNNNAANGSPWITDLTAARFINLKKEDVQVSEWWNRWFSETTPEKLVLSAIDSQPTTHRMRLEIINDHGCSVTSPPLHIEYRAVSKYESLFVSQGVSKLLKLSLWLKYEDNSYKLSVEPADYFGEHVCETYKLFRFWDALTKGGTLKFIFESNNETWLEFQHLPNPDDPISSETLDLLKKLCLIQGWIGHNLYVPSNGLISQQDVSSCNQLISIFTRGLAVSESPQLEITIEGDNLNELWQNISSEELLRFTKAFPDAQEMILGQSIDLGRRIMFLSGFLDQAKIIPQSNHSLLVSEQMEIIHLHKVEIINLYPDIFIQEARRLAQLLGHRFGVERVYLFGSLAWGETLNPQTDIDLAVSGLLPESFFAAAEHLQQETAFPFNLIALETALATLHQQILHQGKLLYERKVEASGGSTNGSSG